MALVVKNLSANAEDMGNVGLTLGWEESLEGGMATRSSILAWRIPMDRGAWQATVCGVAKSRTRLRRLSLARHKYIYFLLIHIAVLQKLAHCRATILQ